LNPIKTVFRLEPITKTIPLHLLFMRALEDPLERPFMSFRKRLIAFILSFKVKARENFIISQLSDRSFMLTSLFNEISLVFVFLQIYVNNNPLSVFLLSVTIISC